jgi:hypothetical protein
MSQIKSSFKSKRFISFTISVILFLVLSLTTQHSLMEISGALSLLTTIYIGGETFRKSDTSI